MQRVRQHQEVGHWTNKIVNGLKSVLQSFITDVQLGSKCTSIPCMIYLSKMCISICRWTKYMVTGLAHKIFKKEQIITKEMYKQKTNNTYLTQLPYKIRPEK